jgi:cyanophycinase
MKTNQLLALSFGLFALLTNGITAAENEGSQAGNDSDSKQIRTMLVGGGKYPKEATARFVEWAGGKDAKILVITWGGGDDGEQWRFDKFKKELQSAGVEDIEMSPTVAEMEKRDGRSRFANSLAGASGVFFTGGDQDKIMDCIEEHELQQSLRNKHADGTPFGGNSAGAAVMSDQMMSPTKFGDDFKSLNTDWIEFRPGIGMIKAGLIDQHFVERRRQNRLFSALIKSDRKWAVGVDEGNAVSFEDGHIVEVFGEGDVWFVTKSEKTTNQFSVRLVNKNQGKMNLLAR